MKVNWVIEKGLFVDTEDRLMESLSKQGIIRKYHDQVNSRKLRNAIRNGLEYPLDGINFKWKYELKQKTYGIQCDNNQIKKC